MALQIYVSTNCSKKALAECRVWRIFDHMGQKSTKSDHLRAYLRRLGNPYASLSIVEVSGSKPRQELGFLHPYAVADAEIAVMEAASNQIRGESPATAKSATSQRPVASARPPGHVGSLTKKEFEVQARGVFNWYTPKLQRHLNKQHREFIARHVSGSPEHRYLIMEELRKYDLRSTPGITPYFNREDELTLDKLLEIEQRVEKKEKKD